MNRRNFFKTIGIPALVLPFVTRLGLPKPELLPQLQLGTDFLWNAELGSQTPIGQVIYIAKDYSQMKVTAKLSKDVSKFMGKHLVTTWLR